MRRIARHSSVGAGAAQPHRRPAFRSSPACLPLVAGVPPAHGRPASRSSPACLPLFAGVPPAHRRCASAWDGPTRSKRQNRRPSPGRIRPAHAATPSPEIPRVAGKGLSGNSWREGRNSRGIPGATRVTARTRRVTGDSQESLIFVPLAKIKPEKALDKPIRDSILYRTCSLGSGAVRRGTALCSRSGTARQSPRASLDQATWYHESTHPQRTHVLILQINQSQSPRLCHVIQF